MEKTNSTPLEYEIRKLGLSEKEAKVYMASLELGKTSVQNLAKKLSLSRPTVYRIIESLESKELINQSRKKGEHFVMPESPDSILGILRTKKRRIEEQEREFLRIISLLKTKCFNRNENEIKVYSGSEGKKFMLEDFSDTHEQNIFVVFPNKNTPLQTELDKIYEKIKKRLGNITIKELHSEELSSSKMEFVKRKHIPNLESYFPGTLIISDKIIYFQKNEIFAIEQKAIIHLLKSILLSLWQEK